MWTGPTGYRQEATARASVAGKPCFYYPGLRHPAAIKYLQPPNVAQTGLRDR